MQPNPTLGERLEMARAWQAGEQPRQRREVSVPTIYQMPFGGSALPWKPYASAVRTQRVRIPATYLELGVIVLLGLLLGVVVGGVIVGWLEARELRERALTAEWEVRATQAPSTREGA